VKPRPAWAGLLAGALVLTACSTTTNGSGHAAPQSPPSTSSSGSPSSGSGSNPNAGSCPRSYVAPDPKRPKITLTFNVSSDHSRVDGTERVVFTPDLDITELVFRLTPNTVPTVAEGNKIQVTSATADHDAGPPTYQQDGADPKTQGGLLHIPFRSKVSAGTTVTADVKFTLTLGGHVFDRYGRQGGFAWFASAQPLLAWQVGYGWHTEPMLQFPVESATSEAAQTELTVVAPSADTVIASGDPRGVEGGNNTRRWHSTIAAARDVSVALGPFQVKDSTVNGVSLRVGTPSNTATGPVTTQIQRAMTSLSKLFGPFPFPNLSIAQLPIQGGGIEYPSSILLLGSSTVVDVHETAHQWFYAMVGNSQALHAWLDEAFATYAEQLVNHDMPPRSWATQSGNVDRPTADYGRHAREYFAITYGKGSAALQAARAAAGPAKFDAALRCYVNASAWRIAVPDDLAQALADLPAAINILKRAGALH
jgi:hypothetical protein